MRESSAPNATRGPFFPRVTRFEQTRVPRVSPPARGRGARGPRRTCLPDRGPVAAERQQPGASPPRDRRPRPTPSRPARPSCSSGPATPVVARPHVASSRSRTPRAIAERALLRDHAVLLDHLGRHAEQRHLHAGGVRHDAADEAARGAGHVGEPGRRAGPPVSDSAVASVSPRPARVSRTRAATLPSGSADHMSATLAAWHSPSRTTHSSATAAPPPWSARTGRSTGCACRASTPPPASPRCSAPRRTAAGCSPRPTRCVATLAAATSTAPRCLETTFTTADGEVVLLDVMPDRRRPRGRRTPPHLHARHGADPARLGGAHRLRPGPAVGEPRAGARQRGRRGGRRSRQARAARAAPPPRPRRPPQRRVRDDRRRRGHLLHDLGALVARHPPSRSASTSGSTPRPRASASGRRARRTTCRTPTWCDAACSPCC